jgi:aspartyl protease family protein
VAAWVAIFFLIVAALVLLVSHDAGTVAGMSNEAFARIAALLAILIFIGGGIAQSYRGRALEAVKHIVTWAAMLVALVGLYAYRGELTMVADRVIGELSPEGTHVNISGKEGLGKAVRIRRGWSGHFIVHALIGGTSVDMIVDTGASTVVLRHEDARRLGVNMRALRYTVPVQTANGSSYAARVRLGDIYVGSVGLRDVEALVAKQGSLHQSLLGMSFLSRLRSYEFSGDYLVLRG